MTFKDLLPQDNENIFFLDELAEFIEIDGVILKAIIGTRTAAKSGNANLNFKGLFGDFTTVYFRTSDYISKRERLPRHSERVKIFSAEWNCEKMFSVTSCTSAAGVCTLILESYRQNTLKGRGITWEEDF